MIKILIGGSPCTYWSIARTGQKNNKIDRETEPEGLGWELFRNYLIAKEKFQPDFFLYENNNSISKAIKACITENLGVENICINSSLLSAQTRKREYWFNWEAEQPEDKNISFQDIKDTDYEYCKEFRVKRTPSRERMWNGGNGRNGNHTCTNVTNAKKTNAVTTKQDRSNNAGLVEFEDFCRYLTTHELEQLQTLPKGYTDGITRSQQEKCIGNGWTAAVIIYLLQKGLKDVSREEEIVVLSMYDGIATGRYCLEQLGFKNITYYAYEIEKSAITVAKNNFPDIIECGDAFKVREDDWKITWRGGYTE